MTTEDDKLWYAIQDIVREHTKQVWITPHSAKAIIPNEEIYALKQDLYKMVKNLQKSTTSDKM